MKKLPLVFSGCLLGLAGAGNLCFRYVASAVTYTEYVRFDFVDILSDFSSA